MIGFLIRLLPAWAWFALAVAVLGSSLALGYRQGAGRVQARWDAAELKRERQAAEQRREDERIGRAAAANFEAWRADQTRRQADIARRLRDALKAPLSCPASGQVADVVIPADAVRSLRDAAGAELRSTEPAAIAGPGLRIRP